MALALLKLIQTPASSLPAKRETAAVAPIKAFDATVKYPAKALERAQEKLLYCQLVVTYASDHLVSEETAAKTVAALNVDRFPLLSTSGKGGKSALSYSSFRNWIRATGRMAGNLPDTRKLAALVDNHYTNEYIRPGNDIWWETFMRVLLNEEQLPDAKAYKIACNIFAGYDGMDMPSFTQVRHYLKNKFPRAAYEMARRGENWAQDRLFHYVHRDWTAIKPGEVWIGDHHMLDVYVRVWDDEKNRWRVTRPWLTAWMDARSMYFVGVEISIAAPNTVSILRALAIGCVESGGHMPSLLYSDNGADFKRQGFATPMEIEGHEHSICAKLGVKTTFSLPYRGRSKTIERIFKEIAEGYCKTLPSYLGNKPDARPETASNFEKHPDLAPDFEDVSEGLKKYLHEVYHRTAQKAGKILGVDTKGDPRAPVTVFRERSTFGRQWDLHSLKEAMLLPVRGSRKVGQGFCVRVDGGDYRAQNFGEELNSYRGTPIMIKQDLFLGGYFAYTVDGKFICPLDAVQTVKAMMAAYDDIERAKLAAELAHAKRQEKWVKAIVKTATGLPVLVSTAEAINLLEPGARLVEAGTKRSVKGSTHKHTIYKVLLPGETLEEIAAPPADTASGACLVQPACTPSAKPLPETCNAPADDDDDIVVPKPDPSLIARLNEIKSQPIDY